jgi:TatD DNase family protein
MKLVDVHAHLESGKFKRDLGSVIERFKEAGGAFVVNSGTDPGRNRETLKLAEKYDCVRASFGMYPIGDYDDVDGELAWIEKHADDCVAIGEIGLDFDRGLARNSVPSKLGTSDEVPFSSGKDAEKQEKLFRKMLELAKKLDKTVVIHSRKAELEAIEILEEMGMSKVVMHCFCGKMSLVKRCVKNGWSFSVPPAIMRWDNFKMLVEVVPLGQLLTETDAPYLSPVVGERNEPANVKITLEEIARIKGLSVEEVGEQIFINAERLFSL